MRILFVVLFTLCIVALVYVLVIALPGTLKAQILCEQAYGPDTKGYWFVDGKMLCQPLLPAKRDSMKTLPDKP